MLAAVKAALDARDRPAANRQWKFPPPPAAKARKPAAKKKDWVGAGYAATVGAFFKALHQDQPFYDPRSIRWHLCQSPGAVDGRLEDMNCGFQQSRRMRPWRKSAYSAGGLALAPAGWIHGHTSPRVRDRP